MPQIMKSKTKRPSKKRQFKFTSSRLMKTNGKFSKGKLAMIAFSFVAIGALVISMTHAWSYQDVVTWQTVAANHWFAGGDCEAAFGSCSFQLAALSNGQILWWGPYHRLGIPSPTGMNDELCINFGMTGFFSSGVFYVEITANYGATLLAHAEVAANGDGSGLYPPNHYQLVCSQVHVPSSIAGYWDAVEYRVRKVQSSGDPYLYIGQVGLFQ